ncbi:MAG TPA: RNA polymerase sigma factor [Solirubrobacteraceae bacterium]|nr:RNA polymerase sigma factor [Solirubrobacteraceae bacterium]
MPALDPESLPRHLDRLYRAAWALCGSPHEAEDLVQETFARVLARPRTLRGQDELAYLMTVLRNTFLTERRTAARRPRASVTTLEEANPVDQRTGERPAEALQTHEIFAAVAGLPDRYRLALVACDVVGLSHREAARALETKEATVATRLFRARRFVVRALEASSPSREDPASPSSEDGSMPALEGASPPSREETPSPSREDRPPEQRLTERSTT